VVEWVKEAWESISEEIIIKSFKKYGISNAMDGSEDDALHDDLVGDDTENDTGSHEELDESNDEMNDFYNEDMIDDEEIKKIFDESDDEEFNGFSTEDIK
jgi:hypothetical protein